MEKKKLLIWADSPAVSTGFGIVVKNLCAYLHEDFEIGILGINHMNPDLEYDKKKYKIFKVTKTDPLGFERFEEAVELFSPDVVLLFQDIFHIFTMKSKYTDILKDLPHVLYFPVDGRPFSRVWRDTILSADAAITYTNWAAKIIKESIPEIRNIPVLPHGIDTSIFYPKSDTDINVIRQVFGWDNKFVVTNLNRFQPRKHINQTLRIMSMFIKGYNECRCGNIYPLHLKECDLNGCDPDEVYNVVKGHPKAALYLHMNLVEPTMGVKPSDWLTSYALYNGFTAEDMDSTIFFNKSKIYDPKSEMKHKDLNNIYNASNVLFSTSMGEGFGFSTAEAMATGTKVMVGRHSANFDLIDKDSDYGVLIKNKSMFNWGRDSGQVRPIMDENEAIDELKLEYKKWNAQIAGKAIYTSGITKINDCYLWKDKAEKLSDILKTALDRKGTDS